MKKRILTLLVALFAVVTLVTVLSLETSATPAPLTFTVANGTDTNSYYPYYSYYADEIGTYQTVYPESMFTGHKPIKMTGLTFYTTALTGNYGTAQFKVTLGTVSSTTISSKQTLTSPVVVYTGSFSVSSGAVTIPFTTKYDYTGGNLCIQVDITSTASNNYVSLFFYGLSQTSQNCYGVHTSNGVPTSDSKFLPKTTFTYEPLEKSLTFNMNEGSWVDASKKPTKYTCGEEFTLPTAADVKRANYVFDGWTATNTESDTTYITKVANTETTDKEFYAKWTEADVEVNFGSGKYQYYKTLKDAVAAVTDSTPVTIKLLKDITANYDLSIASGRDITIDMNGKTITCDGTSIYINGNLKVISSAATRGMITGKVKNKGILFRLFKGGNITLSKVNVENTTQGGCIIQTEKECGTLTFNDVTFANNTCTYDIEVFIGYGSVVLSGVVNVTNDNLFFSASEGVVADIKGLNKDSRINFKTTAASENAGVVFATGAAKEHKDCFINTKGDKYNIEYVDGTLQLKLVTTADRYAKVTKDVATGSSYNADLLFSGMVGDGGRKYCFTEYVITKTSLDGAGTIYSMTYTVNLKYSIGERRVDVYLKNIGTSNIASASIPVTKADLVYSGRAVITGDKLTLTLDKPFKYDGGNLLVAVNDVTGVINGNGAVVLGANPLKPMRVVYSSRNSVAYTESDSASLEHFDVAPVPYIVFNKTSATSIDDTVEVTRQDVEVIEGEMNTVTYNIDISSFDYLPKKVDFKIKWDVDPVIIGNVSDINDRKATLSITNKTGSKAGFYYFTINTGKDDDAANCEKITYAICPKAPAEGVGYSFSKGIIYINSDYEVAKVDTFGNINWNDTLQSSDKYVHTQRYAVRLKETPTMPHSDYTIFTAPEYCAKEVEKKLADGSFDIIRCGNSGFAAAKLTFAKSANGWTIYNTDTGMYVALDSDNAYVASATSFEWQYENGRFYAVRVINTGASATERMAARPFSRAGKTAKFFLKLNDVGSYVITMDGSGCATSFLNYEETTSHAKTYIYASNSQHILYCTTCRESYYVDCAFDAEGKCVCGRVLPGCQTTSFNATLTSLEVEGFKYKDDSLNKELYSMVIEITDSNYEIESVSYSFDNKNYRVGNEFNVDSATPKFYFRITAKGGYEYTYLYKNGTFLPPLY